VIVVDDEYYIDYNDGDIYIILMVNSYMQNDDEIDSDHMYEK